RGLCGTSCPCATPAPPWFYPLSLHDALPIWAADAAVPGRGEDLRPDVLGAADRQHRPGHFHPQLQRPCALRPDRRCCRSAAPRTDRKSTRLNSSHVKISYAVFCLKKKKKKTS